MQAHPTVEPFIKLGVSGLKIRFDIQLPPLVPGRYMMGAWAGASHTETLDNCPDCVSFEIHESPTLGRSFPHTSDHGFLVPSCTFIFEPE
jgi:hypothetical protein